MNKGEVVEEGDHDSLMDRRGIYYGLVEQQNLLRAEEEEQLAFEQQESAGLVRIHQAEENQLPIAARQRASSIISLSPSVIAALYGKNKKLTEDEETEEDSKKKVIINIQLI
jgi:hypothetical protein